MISDQEKANVVTHQLALIILCSVMAFILFSVAIHWTFASLVGFLIFCVMIVFCYSSSIQYHLQSDPTSKKYWRRIDHICIYLLIGGSYTAFLMKYMYHPYGMQFLAIHWLIIILGILKKIWFTGRFELISVASYLLLGWMVMWIYDDITAVMSERALQYLILGGVCYSVGVIFYAWERYKYHHAIWHIFVFGGTLSHCISLIYD